MEEVGVPMEVIDVDESDDEIEIVPAVSNPYFRIWSVFLINPPAWQEAGEDARRGGGGGGGPARVRGRRFCCGATAGK